MNSDVSRWFCCLNPRERGVLGTLLSALGASLWLGMPKAAFDASWLFYAPSGSAMQIAFLSIFGFEIATIETEIGEVSVVRSLVGWLPYHAHWLIFVNTPGGLCSAGCGFSYV